MTIKQFHSHSKPKPNPVLSCYADQFPVLVHWATTETFVLSQRRQMCSFWWQWHHFDGKATVKIWQVINSSPKMPLQQLIAVRSTQCLGLESQPNELCFRPLTQLETSGSHPASHEFHAESTAPWMGGENRAPRLTGLAGEQAPAQLVRPARLASWAQPCRETSPCLQKQKGLKTSGQDHKVFLAIN